jgi:hypothetical protein
MYATPRPARAVAGVCGLLLTILLVAGCAPSSHGGTRNAASSVTRTPAGSSSTSTGPTPRTSTTPPASTTPRQTTPAQASPGPQHHATLTINQGLALPSGRVVESMDPAASITFILNQNGLNSGSFYVPDGHILLPTSSNFNEADIQQAPQMYLAGLVPGYVFVVETPDGGHYALRIDDFANQGMGSTDWRLSLTWQEL